MKRGISSFTDKRTTRYERVRKGICKCQYNVSTMSVQYIVMKCNMG